MLNADHSLCPLTADVRTTLDFKKIYSLGQSRSRATIYSLRFIVEHVRWYQSCCTRMSWWLPSSPTASRDVFTAVHPVWQAGRCRSLSLIFFLSVGSCHWLTVEVKKTLSFAEVKLSHDFSPSPRSILASAHTAGDNPALKLCGRHFANCIDLLLDLPPTCRPS